MYAGYFSNEEATALTLNSDGWLSTGDLCYIDEDGFLFIVDRLKELIKYKGYQVIASSVQYIIIKLYPLLFCARIVGSSPLS